ncbi:MAG: hypothetical protein WCI31_15795 [Prolixibacteraceae bacterium]
MKKLLFIVLVLLFSGILKAQEQHVVVPYTLADLAEIHRSHGIL